MGRGYRFDDAESEVLDTLVLRTRVAIAEQLGELPGLRAMQIELVRRRLRRLRGLGMLRCSRWAVRVPQVREPLFEMEAGGTPPPFERVVWACRRRVERQRPNRVTIFWATTRAADLLGGSAGRIRRPGQVEHDLGVTAAYVARLKRRPREASRWIGEDLLGRRFHAAVRKCRPDAAILNERGQLETLIEYAGQYGVKKLVKLDSFSRSRNVGYELW